MVPRFKPVRYAKLSPAPMRRSMTLLDVVFKYGTPPGEKEMLALNNAWEVYGVRKINFNEKEHTIRVEYDATRLNDGEIAAILRRGGVDTPGKRKPGEVGAGRLG